MATDFVRTRSEEGNLRDKAIVALVAVGASAPTRTLLPRLRGDAAVDRERWSDACDAYRAVLAQEPKDSAALGGLAYASSRLERYDDAVAAYAQLAALDPDDATALVDLARAQAKDGHAALAYGTFAKAVALAKRHVDASPRKASAVRTIAWVHLYAGRTYAANGEPGHARDQFERMLAWTKRLPPNDERHDMYLEEGQEAIAALALGSRAGFSVSLAPWTGAELPGSIPHTLKYRLIVAGRPGRNVRLAASRVPRYWVASFCSDRVCAPGRVGISLPQSGVKIVEFQLVPPHGSALAPKVRVTGTDGTSQASGTT
jgi:tetratricopeptide (TPR) repeat protein